MTHLLDLAGALLSFIFRIITAPVLFLLYSLLAILFFVQFIRQIQIKLPVLHFKLNRSFFPIQLKRLLLFSKQ